MSDVMTLKTFWLIRRDDGEVCEKTESREQAGKWFLAYDATEYELVPWQEYVKAEPLPFYPGPLARFAARLKGLGR